MPAGVVHTLPPVGRRYVSARPRMAQSAYAQPRSSLVHPSRFERPTSTFSRWPLYRLEYGCELVNQVRFELTYTGLRVRTDSLSSHWSVVDPENFEISTCRLKDGCSASELRIHGAHPENRTLLYHLIRVASSPDE